jgi:hypothetical protein
MKKSKVSDSAPINQVKDLDTLFEQIRLRPEMWLGHDGKDIRILDAYLVGIEFGEFFYDIESDKLTESFARDSFEAWVAEKYNRDRLSANSRTLAYLISENGSEAFDLWFSWYDEFKNL